MWGTIERLTEHSISVMIAAVIVASLAVYGWLPLTKAMLIGWLWALGVALLLNFLARNANRRGR